MVQAMINTIYDISPGYWYEFLLQFLFAVVTLFVGYYAWKVYKMTSQKQARLFSISFFFISLGYLVSSVFNFLILFELRGSITNMLELFRLVFFDRLGLSIHIFMMITGLVILLCMTLKVEKPRTFFLIFLISLIAIFFAANRLFMFFILSSLFLAFIAYHYILNFIEKKQTNRMVIALAFIFLFLGRTEMIFVSSSAFFYHTGHVLELLAYSFILWNFTIIKNEQKKRPARSNP